MTSSCFHYGSWMTTLLCLFSGGAPKGPVGLADTHPRGLLWVEPRAMAGQLGWKDLLGISGLAIFCTKNAHFGLETSISPFFNLFWISHDFRFFF